MAQRFSRFAHCDGNVHRKSELAFESKSLSESASSLFGFVFEAGRAVILVTLQAQILMRIETSHPSRLSNMLDLLSQ